MNFTAKILILFNNIDIKPLIFCFFRIFFLT